MDADAKNKIMAALEHYCKRTGYRLSAIKAVLFDMDGVLYDSMPLHARAWKLMCDQIGIEADVNEFFAYEGRTGASTIDLLIRRQYGRPASADEKVTLYDLKAHFFTQMPPPPVMPGAVDAVSRVVMAGCQPVLVTGSGQASILNRLKKDYNHAFTLRITSADVSLGKPDPEPYVKGMELAGSAPYEAIAIDNAPLGVESASKAGAFTIGVATGPLPVDALAEAGADIVLNSMHDCAKMLGCLL